MKSQRNEISKKIKSQKKKNLIKKSEISQKMKSEKNEISKKKSNIKKKCDIKEIKSQKKRNQNISEYSQCQCHIMPESS